MLQVEVLVDRAKSITLMARSDASVRVSNVLHSRPGQNKIDTAERRT